MLGKHRDFGTSMTAHFLAWDAGLSGESQGKRSGASIIGCVTNCGIVVCGGMLTRTGLNAGRLFCRGLPFRIASIRSQSTTAPIVPLSFDLHLPPSKEEYSSSQKAPAVVLMHGVPSHFHCHSIDFVVSGLKIEFTYSFKTPRSVNSYTSVRTRPPQSRGLYKKRLRGSFIPIDGWGRRKLPQRAGIG